MNRIDQLARDLVTEVQAAHRCSLSEAVLRGSEVLHKMKPDATRPTVAPGKLGNGMTLADRVEQLRQGGLTAKQARRQASCEFRQEFVNGGHR